MIGNVIISTAPLFCIPLVLTLCTWFFSNYLGCLLPALPQSVDSADALIMMGGGVLETFTRNLIVKFNAWFLVYLFIVLSLILSAAPSLQDLKNASVGICILAVTGVVILWSQIPWAVSILTEITRIMGMGFAIGLGLGLIALVLSSPLVILYLLRRTA
jgi:hypothetical protein